MNILSYQHLNIIHLSEIKTTNETPSWQKRADISIEEEHYDENKFLQGGIQTVGPVVDIKPKPKHRKSNNDI